ncbi:MAG: hypothetical protein AAGA92_04420 [Planctomycetota bacterium]
MDAQQFDGSFSWYEELKGESGGVINSILCLCEFSQEELLDIRRAIVHQLIVVDGEDLLEIHQKTLELREALMNVTARIRYY